MEELFKQIGLTPSESKVYLALLEIGESKVSQILEKAKLNSGRIYDVLNSLKNKGLVSEIVKEKIKLFVPSHPDRILDYLSAEEDKVKENKLKIKSKLPELNLRYKSIKQNTDVEVFLGIEGMKTAYATLFKEAEIDRKLCVYGIVSKKHYKKEIIDMLKYYVYKKRKELKLHTRKLISEEARSNKIYSEDDSIIKYLPYFSMTGIEILGHIVLIQFFHDPIIMILIRNKKIATDYKKLFEFLWKVAKK